MNIKGQALIEYLLIVGVIGVFIIFFVSAFGGFVKDSFTEMYCELFDKDYVPGEKEGEARCVERW